MTGLEISTESARDAVIVRLTGEVDVSNIARLAGELRAAATGHVAIVVLDLAGLHYMDSAGVRVLFEVARSTETARQELVLVVPQGSPVRRLLTITKMGDVARIVESLDEAFPKESSPNQQL